jgi:hypothetical protein
VLVAVDLDPHALVLQASNAGDGTVHPAFVGVVAQEHDLGAGLEQQRCFGRLRRLAEFAADAGLVLVPRARQRIEVGLVDAAGGRRWSASV